MKDLKSIIQENPYCLSEKKTLEGSLRDYGWDRRTIRILVNLYDFGIVEKIRENGNRLSREDVYQLVSRQEEHYGTARSLIDEGIRLWAEALGAEEEGLSSIAEEEEPKIIPKTEPTKHKPAAQGFCGSNHLDANRQYSSDDLGNGENITWSYDGKGTLTISGSGAMADYRYFALNARPWHSFKDEITAVYIDGGITTIGNNAFSNCSRLITVHLHEGLCSIGMDAFYQCPQLSKINFPNSLAVVSNSAFHKCSSLKSVLLPHVCSAKYAFEPDVVVTHSNVALPEAGGSCGANLTWHYDGLGTLTISGKGEMDDYSLIPGAPWHDLNGKIVTIRLNDGITRIGDNAFYLSLVEELVLPKTIQEIGKYAFWNASLKTITLPENLKIIDAGAFEDCRSLIEVKFPDSLKSIGAKAFDDCEDLQTVTLNRKCRVADDAFSATTTVNYVGAYRGVDFHLQEQSEKNEKTEKVQAVIHPVKHDKDEKIELAFGWVSIILCISYFCALCTIQPFTFAFIDACVLVLTAVMQYRLSKGGFNRLFQNEKWNGIYESLGQVFMWIFGIIMALAVMGALGCINSDEPIPYEITVAFVSVAVVAWYHTRWHFGFVFPDRKH